MAVSVVFAGHPCFEKYEYKETWTNEGWWYENAWCELGEIPEGIPSDVTFLYLKYNDITDIPPGSFKDLTLLYDLDLGGNDLTTLRGDMWEGLEHLEGLRLAENQIVALSRDSFSVESSNGRYSSPLKSNCRSLGLEVNQISDIQPGTFSDLTRLGALSLGSNKLTEIRGDMWKGLDKLTQLFLDSNQISILEDSAFSSLKSLRQLDLKRNQLTVVTGTMVTTGSLANLILQENQIASIRGLPRANYIHLENNNLTSLERDTFVPDDEDHAPQVTRSIRTSEIT